jgi:hypothetical protein
LGIFPKLVFLLVRWRMHPSACFIQLTLPRSNLFFEWHHGQPPPCKTRNVKLLLDNAVLDSRSPAIGFKNETTCGVSNMADVIAVVLALNHCTALLATRITSSKENCRNEFVVRVEVASVTAAVIGTGPI